MVYIDGTCHSSGQVGDIHVGVAYKFEWSVRPDPSIVTGDAIIEICGSGANGFVSGGWLWFEDFIHPVDVTISITVPTIHGNIFGVFGLHLTCGRRAAGLAADIQPTSAVMQGHSQWYLFNARGDVIALTDAAGHVIREYRYDAFGNEVDPCPDDTNPWRFKGDIGYYWDNETGTHYIRMRFYNPRTGRFTTEDPIRDGLNWYTYVGNSPIMFIDPWGLARVNLVEYARGQGATITHGTNSSTGRANVTISHGGITHTFTNYRSGQIQASVLNDRFGWGFGGSMTVLHPTGYATWMFPAPEPWRPPLTITQNGNNIFIEARFNIRGRGANLTLDGVTFRDLFLLGVENVWSGTFGDYIVSTHARECPTGIRVNITDGKGHPRVRHSVLGWSPNRPGTVFMYTQFTDGMTFTAQQFMNLAAHEFGHNLGLMDMPAHAQPGNIMRFAYDGWDANVSASAGNIADVLNAQLLRRHQRRW